MAPFFLDILSDHARKYARGKQGKVWYCGRVLLRSFAVKRQKLVEDRAVYASNIPRDATFEKIEETSKKANIIERGVVGRLGIGMSSAEDGNFDDVLDLCIHSEVEDDLMHLEALSDQVV
ncbi:uncharacterized protein CC84DRAFT_1216342 [Paraphaeosphaeria sporulosa]|uniref:Uncharacterized protein n=1 Tax=Paraphaeosphaeria sporulosa TaxID=1460663 RepID=A0A177CJD4_9PLEO|nr:uncharacterized protein CC84DRAFT_1216342 [Paraphaeosphaeria sporulosa]OAG07371.1 hypothetical protein CC84DRAFT_1216342 [Paraphaeosphaeria sporulosa]